MLPRKLAIQRLGGRTVPALLCATARRLPGKVFLHVLAPPVPGAAAPAAPREVTFVGFRRGVSRAAATLARAGLGRGDRLLIAAENSPEWQMLALGAQVIRAEPVAVFASLAAGTTQETALRVGARAAFVSGAAQWEKLAPIGPALQAAGLALVVAGEPLDPATLPPGLRVLSLPEACGEEAAELGEAELEARVAEVSEEDPFLLLFTSGTTGRPKGVRIPQRAIVHAVESGEPAVGTTEDDRGLHFLPFAHVAGHDQFVLALAEGHALVMFTRREELPRALALAPTYLFSVPLVYERVRLAAEAHVEGMPGPLRRLLQAALSAAGRVRVDGSRRLADRALSALAGAALGRAVRRRLGGNVRGLFSGGAPAAPALFRFFESLGIPFVELYGMSETAGFISSNSFAGARRPGSAGLSSPDHELRLAPDGELLLRGPLLFSGYLDEADTREAFTEDGFFRTGDVVRVDEQGELRVEGRKKALMVLSTGKKLSPEPIEAAIASTTPFEGAVLLGEGRPFVAAAVFVGHAELDRLAARGMDAAEALLPRVRAALAAFSEYEKPKRLVVLRGSPQDHPGLVTPTLKVKREALLEALGPRLAALYAPA